MEIEEAIKAMKEDIQICKDNQEEENIDFMIRKGFISALDRYAFIEHEKEQIEGYKTAIQALEKQIGKKPNADDCCPDCDTYLKDDNDVEGLYCPNCGQKIDWGDEQ